MERLISFDPSKPEFLNPAIARGFLVERSEMQGISGADDHRLVKASKSATSPKAADLEALAVERQKLESMNQRHFLSVGGLKSVEKAKEISKQSQYDLIAAETISEYKRENPDQFAELEKFDKARALSTSKSTLGKKLTEAEIEDRVNANNKKFPLLENQVGAGRYAVIEKRWWSDEYRIRTQSDKLANMPVPENSGDRKTKTLSMRGARAVADSCEFMAAKHGGYKTFLTLTFSDEARQRLGTFKVSRKGKAEQADMFNGFDGEACKVEFKEITIQQEVKRFFDGISRVFARGFQYVNDNGETVEVEPHHGAPKDWTSESGEYKTLPYCWVVEIPKNEQGEDNPHLHVLLGWRIAYKHFDAWSKRIESLWGQGFAHLEKIKEAEHAGAYMAKAAGYLSKAQGAEDQGEVKGNRYWISKPSRADGWECVERSQMGEMGGLIRDVYRFMQFKYGHVFKKRAELSTQAAALRKSVKNGEQVPEKKRQQVATALTRCRSFIKELPARSTKYSLIIKGFGNYATFLNWAARPYSKDHTPKLLHKDGELKAYWLPVAFGVRRGWKGAESVGTKYFETLMQERKQRENRNSKIKKASGICGGLADILKSEAKRAAYCNALSAG